jgi:hypothetical protein
LKNLNVFNSFFAKELVKRSTHKNAVFSGPKIAFKRQVLKLNNGIDCTYQSHKTFHQKFRQLLKFTISLSLSLSLSLSEPIHGQL